MREEKTKQKDICKDCKEIGHALGCDDDWPNRMINVNANENSVTVELGEKPRIKY